MEQPTLAQLQRVMLQGLAEFGILGQGNPCPRGNLLLDLKPDRSWNGDLREAASVTHQPGVFSHGFDDFPDGVFGEFRPVSDLNVVQVS